MMNIKQWAKERRTSEEIAQAIFELARNNEDQAVKIWSRPTPSQKVDILRRAWALAMANGTLDFSNELLWGKQTVEFA